MRRFEYPTIEIKTYQNHLCRVYRIHYPMDLTQVTWLVKSREFEGFKSITLWGLSWPPPLTGSGLISIGRTVESCVAGGLTQSVRFLGQTMHVAIHSQQRFICPWAGTNKIIDYSSHLRMANSGNQHSSMPSLAEGVQSLVGKFGVVVWKTYRHRWCKTLGLAWIYVINWCGN